MSVYKTKEDVIRFIENLKQEDNICIIYHRDMDGLCSGILVMNILSKMNIGASFFDCSLDNEDILKDLNLLKFNRLILLDIAIDHIKPVNVGNHQKVLIVDHHPPSHDMSDDNILHYNSHFDRHGEYLPVTYIVYKMFENKLKDRAWVAALGTAADFGLEYCGDLLSKFTKAKTKQELVKSSLMKTANVILGASFILGFNTIFEKMFSAKNEKELVRDKEIVDSYKVYEKEFKKTIKYYYEHAQKRLGGKIVFAEVKTKWPRMSSPLITTIAVKEPEKVMMILEQRNERIKISARTGIDGINLGKIFESICLDIKDASGGGHEKAAGAIMPKDRLKQFLDKAEQELGKQIK